MSGRQRQQDHWEFRASLSYTVKPGRKQQIKTEQAKTLQGLCSVALQVCTAGPSTFSRNVGLNPACSVLYSSDHFEKEKIPALVLISESVFLTCHTVQQSLNWNELILHSGQWTRSLRVCPAKVTRGYNVALRFSPSSFLLLWRWLLFLPFPLQLLHL